MYISKSAAGWLGILRKRWAIFALVVILIGVGIFGILVSQMAFGGMVNVSGLSKTQFDSVSVGDPVKLVFEVVSVPSSGQLSGNYLEPGSNGTYRRTSDTLTVKVTPATSIVMGQASDVHPGAVLQIQGQRSDDHSVTAQSLVILTGYVTIQ